MKIMETIFTDFLEKLPEDLSELKKDCNFKSPAGKFSDFLNKVRIKKDASP